MNFSMNIQTKSMQHDFCLGVQFEIAIYEKFFSSNSNKIKNNMPSRKQCVCTTLRQVLPSKPWYLVNSRQNTPPSMARIAYARTEFMYNFMCFSFGEQFYGYIIFGGGWQWGITFIFNLCLIVQQLFPLSPGIFFLLKLLFQFSKK